jgi:hypothetical protein
VALCHAVVVVAACCLAGCKQPLIVGEWRCPETVGEAGSPPAANDPLSLPWSTGFEDHFCDYTRMTGSCYDYQPATHRLVTSPVHSGQLAAAFTVTTGTDGGAVPQSRCLLPGVLPAEAYYGAWYFIPETATNKALWNLIHFQSGNFDGSSLHNIWDVSLVNDSSGRLVPHIYGALHDTAGDGPPIPIGRWFQIVFYLKRAKDKTGAVALYDQDGTRLLSFSNLITDDADRAQWYVGNLASDLDPPESTVYVDDITIRASL